jgi:hypothetical protein
MPNLADAAVVAPLGVPARAGTCLALLLAGEALRAGEPVPAAWISPALAIEL